MRENTILAWNNWHVIWNFRDIKFSSLKWVVTKILSAICHFEFPNCDEHFLIIKNNRFFYLDVKKNWNFIWELEYQKKCAVKVIYFCFFSSNSWIATVETALGARVYYRSIKPSLNSFVLRHWPQLLNVIFINNLFYIILYLRSYV